MASGMAAFEVVALPFFLDPWRAPLDDRFTRLRYTAWQLLAACKVLRLNRVKHFRLIHHCSWGTLTGPTFVWATGIPFVWGPIGGGQTTPMVLARFLGRGGNLERFRNFWVRCTAAMPWVKVTVRRARHCFVTNHSTLDAVQRLGGQNVSVLPLDAITNLEKLPIARGTNGSAPQIIWVGRLIPRKAPLLALEVHARVLQTLDARLVFAGGGELRKVCEARARELGIGNRVSFLGQVRFQDIPALLGASELMIFTSIRDSFPQVALEALASGVPVVLLGHHGAELLPPAAVVTIPVTTPEETVSSFAAAVVRVLSQPELKRNMSLNGLEEVRRNHLWSHRMETVTRVYDSILTAEDALADPAGNAR
jgi:glycosyltransferase involved in cell wall biosynthesis